MILLRFLLKSGAHIDVTFADNEKAKADRYCRDFHARKMPEFVGDMECAQPWMILTNEIAGVQTAFVQQQTQTAGPFRPGQYGSGGFPN